jgi:2-polyprenyl-6-methoxyphenol hydroxylase-like FAD-dependent oxidoreductase
MQHSSSSDHRSHAIVIGASIGGMCAAVALARHFRRVTILERDELSTEPLPRRGVPQSLQPHGLLLRGRAEVEALFPGLMRTLIERGAFEFNGIAQIGRYTAYGWLPRYLGLSANAFACTRPLLEVTMRELLLAQNENVQIVQGIRVESPIFERDADGVWVRGVSTSASDPELKELRADLVVDASGRGSLGARWLSLMGLEEPEIVRVDAKCNYATRYYRAPEGSENWWWKALIIDNAPPRSRRACSLLRVEGDRWIVTAIGSAGDYAPTDEQGWLAYIKSLRSPLAYEALRNAEPLSEVIQSRATANVWRQMHRYRGKLHGLLLVADAVCGYNPSYGQGMTAAALTAQCLHEGLSAHKGSIDVGFLRSQYAAVARYLVEGWEVAAILDLRWPTAEGKRPLGVRMRHWLIRLLEQVAFHHPKVLASVIPFTDFGTSRLSLFNPMFLLRLGFGALHLVLARPTLPGPTELDLFAETSAESHRFRRAAEAEERAA